jgi:tripartite-type tricarboxylate transporter receptor subunit TctC
MFRGRGRVPVLAMVIGALVMTAVGCGDDSDEGGGGAATASDDCDGFPSNDVEFIIPTDPGGGFDTWARLLAPTMEEKLPNNPNVLPINRPGAGTLAGTQEVYSGKPDGYRIVINDPSQISLPQVTGETEMDLAKMTGVAKVATQPELIVTGSDSEYESMEDLAAADARMATAGLGASNVVVMDRFGMAVPFEFNVHDGSGEAVLSVVRGDTDYAMFPVSSVLESVQAGDVRPLVLIGDKPADGEPGAEELADVPTMDELVEAGAGEIFQQHRIVMAAPETPECVVDILSTAITESLEDPALIEQAAEAGLTPSPADAAEAQSLMDQNLETYTAEADVLQQQLESQ